MGVTLGSVKELFPELLFDNYLFTVNEDNDINEKHTIVSDDNLVYLPDTEYIRFLEKILSNFEDNYKNCFLASIGYGDSDVNTIYSVYNDTIITSTNKPELKHSIPNMTLLVEGIDGSGKDTFVKLLVKELKNYFKYDGIRSISVMGQPDSHLSHGVEAKKFIEDKIFTTEKESYNDLCENRKASELKIKKINGIKILIRGFVTDRATFNYVFNKDINLAEGTYIKKWDYFIVVHSEPKIADHRISIRGIPRTWREDIDYLTYFSKYYLKFDSLMFEKKLIIINKTIEELKSEAKKLAKEIYDRTK